MNVRPNSHTAIWAEFVANAVSPGGSLASAVHACAGAQPAPFPRVPPAPPPAAAQSAGPCAELRRPFRRSFLCRTSLPHFVLVCQLPRRAHLRVAMSSGFLVCYLLALPLLADETIGFCFPPKITSSLSRAGSEFLCRWGGWGSLSHCPPRSRAEGAPASRPQPVLQLPPRALKRFSFLA